MSFINQINTSTGARPPQPRPNTLDRLGNSVLDFGRSAADEISTGVQNAALGAVDDARSAARGYVDRSIDSLGRSVKDALSEQIAKRATNPIRDAIGKVGSGLLGDFFDGFLGEDQVVPPQYVGAVNQTQSPEEMYHGDNYAMFKYGLNAGSDSVNDKHPAMKFMFAADFVFDTANPHFSEQMMKTFPAALTASLKNTTFPKMEVESEEINRYNRSIVSTRRVRYQPITATFGETVGHNTGVDNSVSIIEMWNSINAYYINDQQRMSAYDGPFGHRSGNPQRNLIKYLDLYFIWPTSTRRVRLVNPYITSFSYDSLDYQTDEQLLATLDIKYEFYELTQVNGSFADFINNNIGQSILNGSPYEFTYSGQSRNMDVVTNSEENDTQRMTNIDNAYSRAMVQLVEQNAIGSASDLLSSNDPVKRELGRQAVERSVDGAASISQGSGVTNAIRDMAQNVGKSANQAMKGLF